MWSDIVNHYLTISKVVLNSWILQYTTDLRSYFADPVGSPQLSAWANSETRVLADMLDGQPETLTLWP